MKGVNWYGTTQWQNTAQIVELLSRNYGIMHMRYPTHRAMSSRIEKVVDKKAGKRQQIMEEVVRLYLKRYGNNWKTISK